MGSMFTLQSAHDIIRLLTQLLAYFLVITPAGAFRAWTTKKMGDPTAQHLGLTSLNPIVHIDIIGIICLLLFGFGWGRQIPLNHSNIGGRCRSIKLLIASFSGVFIYIIQALICLILLAVLLGSDLQMLMNEQISSLALVIGRILITCVGLCSFLTVIELIINSILLLVTFFLQKHYEPHYLLYVLLLAPLIILLLFGQPLQNLFMEGIVQIADSIAHVIGIT